MTPIEQAFTNGIRIKAIKDQIRENDWRGSVGNYFDVQWWYARANESLEKRILMYK